MRILLFILCMLVGLTGINAQQLSRTEKKIAAAVSRNAPQAIAFLEKVVNINSGTLNLEGVREVGGVFGTAFEEIGFTTRWIPMPDEMNRAGHLFAEIEGNRGKRLLLIGHLDTVFEKDSPFQQFERVNDTLAHAPGGNDMKGGDVIVLFALKALQEEGLLDDAQI
ncbi:MAG: M20/M25/M40 family metallo-hydrolase, partial [Robiginitalea sp.]|nr:M20/M25/M40 family metallo-hydrolase [Robiginitalea sp.]